MKKIIFLVFGWGFIIVGFFGLFLPFIQGILCMAIGLYLLSHESVWAKQLLEKIYNKFPGLRKAVYETKEKIKNWFGK